jgi:hypothetical protein
VRGLVVHMVTVEQRDDDVDVEQGDARRYASSLPFGPGGSSGTPFCVSRPGGRRVPGASDPK